MKHMCEKPKADTKHEDIHCSKCGAQILCQEKLGDFDFNRGAVCLDCTSMFASMIQGASRSQCDCDQCGEPKAGVAS